MWPEDLGLAPSKVAAVSKVKLIFSLNQLPRITEDSPDIIPFPAMEPVSHPWQICDGSPRDPLFLPYKKADRTSYGHSQ